MFEKVSTDLDFVARELEVQKFWKENKIFEKSVAQSKGRPAFTFYDGPPTANGKPHIGHILTRVVKDIIPRYKTMKGYDVLRKAGWDTHGLPVELEVEKELGISGKPQIEDYGIEPFIKKCKESVWKYENQWRDMSDRVGFWADMDDPYVTYHNSYIESEWWAIKKIWDMGLLYKGHKIVPYCPRCGTALSSHEVAQGYKDVKEASIYVKFKAKSQENTYFLAWTTTPWTLPSNGGLAVNAKQDYAYVKSGEDTYIMAAALLDTVLTEPYETLKTCKGKELEFMEYEPLFDFYKTDEKCWFVTCADYVTLSDGTGIVHIAPAFGEDDAQAGRKYGIPFIQLVNEAGEFVECVKPWAGMFVKDADPLIIKNLKEAGKLYKKVVYEHNYPFCWRCDTSLLYYARDAWFIEMTRLRERLVTNNNTVNWLPESMKAGRFGNFLENVIDWGLSRERYWGTPLPIWECGCGHRHAIGSIQELKDMGGNVPEDLELHRPYIDKVLIDCPQCGKKMKRVAEVIDCWFDSGSMPFAQWHYPFENQEIFKDRFPADFISEAVDQTRGWFYTLMAISTLIFDKSPFKNVIVMGHVQDKDGQKMSKHKGNVVDPWDVLDKQGADAVRWYFIINSAPWLPNRFYDEAVSEGQRKFMGTLWNTYAFFVLYANIDGFDPKKYSLEPKLLPPMDKWILSKLNSLIKTVDGYLENYRLTEPARALNEFVDQLSNWYVRRSRERFWGKDMPQDKINAYMTLYTVLTELIRLAAPFIPFMTEEIYQNLVKSTDPDAQESIHLCAFPEADDNLIDPELEKNMDEVLKLVALGRAARNNVNIKNRQPLSLMHIKTELELPEMFVDIIAEELNIKEVRFTGDVKEYITYKFKPQLRTLGPKYGKLVPKINETLQAADGNELMDQLNEREEIRLTVEDNEVSLSREDVLIEPAQKEGFMAESGGGRTAVLSTVLTEELIEEGFVRELISKLQTMRKEAGFNVLDRINVSYKGNEKLAGIFERNKETIKDEVLAEEIVDDSPKGYCKNWNINGEEITLGVERI